MPKHNETLKIEGRVATFDSPLVVERSIGSVDLGVHKCRLTLGNFDKSGYADLELEALDDELYQVIGVYVSGGDKPELTDYDGIMGFLPIEAASLLESLGISVDREQFCDGD